MSADQDTRPTSFPHDIASCHAMLESVFQSLAERNQRIDQLESVVDTLVRERFGPKSERYDPNQLALFQLQDEEDSSVAEPPETEDATPPKRRRGGNGRRRLDPNARRVQKLHRLRDDQKHCPKCGAVFKQVAKDVGADYSGFTWHELVHGKGKDPQPAATSGKRYAAVKAAYLFEEDHDADILFLYKCQQTAKRIQQNNEGAG